MEKKSLAAIVHINQNDQMNGHRPSAGVLFKSAAKYYGSSVLAVIMTGMGRDGSAEIGEIYRAGGLTLAKTKPPAWFSECPKSQSKWVTPSEWSA